MQFNAINFFHFQSVIFFTFMQVVRKESFYSIVRPHQNYYKQRNIFVHSWLSYQQNEKVRNLVICSQNLPISNFAKSKLDITSKELEEERAEANNVLKK